METPKTGSSLICLQNAQPKGFRRKTRPSSRTRLGMKPFQVRECCCCCCWEEIGCECGCSEVDWKSFSARGDHVDEGRNLRTLSRLSSPPRRRGRSSPAVFQAGLQKRHSEMDLRKVKRSLKLLGFELSEFGIYSGGLGRTSKWKGGRKCPKLQTKVSSRSVSLDSLRESVRRAWEDDRLDDSYRRLLSQAAYEEWYFRKERELWERQKEEKVRRMRVRGSLREDIEKKKEKSEEEFKKWLQRKKTKRKDKKEFPCKKDSKFSVLMKSKEEIEEAFQKWKKAKDEELEKRKRERKQAEEQKKASEKQKAEKKATAEKAFIVWKTKVEENERKEEEKRQKRKKRQEEIQKRLKGEKENAVSFQIWKQAKDLEIKTKMKQIREAERTAREQRLLQMEERMYEAEQAFEDWLEKVDTRKQKHFCFYQNSIPWIPA